MKMHHQILVLLLALTLGFSTACSSDEPNSRNNNNSQQGTDSGPSDKDVEITDDKDVEITDDKDVETTDDKDVEITDDKDVETTDDQDTEITDDQDAEPEDDADVTPDPNEDRTPLQDLSDEQIIALCKVDSDNVNAFFDPASDTGVAYCLLFAAYAAYEEGKDPAEIIGECEATMASCTGDFGSTDPGKCMNQFGCNATVADFERCSNDNIAAFAAQTNSLLDKTCSDYTTEQSHQSLDAALDAYGSPQSCADLLSKCPQLYDL